MKYEGIIMQDGVKVVSAFGNLEDVWCEIGHYVDMYLQDGPIDRIEIKRVKR